MKAYPWPGNVRELENVVRRLTALYPQDVITREIIESELKAEGPTSPLDAGESLGGPVTISQAVEETCGPTSPSFRRGSSATGLYRPGAA
jgi:two-component system nitrogen regulation response regulator GlnG